MQRILGFLAKSGPDEHRPIARRRGVSIGFMVLTYAVFKEGLQAGPTPMRNKFF
jgi:hypothetical protein